MATQDHTVDGTEITPAPWTLPAYLLRHCGGGAEKSPTTLGDSSETLMLYRAGGTWRCSVLFRCPIWISPRRVSVN